VSLFFQRSGIPPRRAIVLALILPVLIAAVPAVFAADCGACSPTPMGCCKRAGCGERSPQAEPIGCCTPRNLPAAPATDSVPVPAQDGDRLHTTATLSPVAAARDAVATSDDRSAPKLPHAVPLFTFHSVLLI